MNIINKIKNIFSKEKKTPMSYYDVDIWSIVNKEVHESIQNGISLYGEIVGQLPNNKWIQKDFDYGCEQGKHDFYVYRVTYTKPDGTFIEFNRAQVDQYCKKYNLKTVPLFYHAKAKDWDTSISVTEHWHQNFLAKLIEKYNEKDCYMCNNKVPEEGVVINREGEFFEPFKLKSFRFLEKESEELDKGEVNIEDSQTAEPTE